MVNQKSKLSLVGIEAFIDNWGLLIAGDLESGGQAASKHVGRLFEVR